MATAAAIWFVLPGYREFALTISSLAWVVGIVGGIVWIALCKLGVEAPLLTLVGLEGVGVRAAFNPLEQMSDQAPLAYAFLAVRFLGLVLIVPVIEEFFLRGFLMRFVMHANWWAIPFGTVNATAIAAATAYGVLTHPAEFIAAAVWFLAITWLMVKKKSIWDCILAHALTNLVLGVYVVWSGDWFLM
jgi:CAAX prenyl protease-like protein